MRLVKFNKSAVSAKALTLVLAFLSWHFFEKYVNGLKKYFPMQQKPDSYSNPVESTATFKAARPEVAPSPSGE